MGTTFILESINYKRHRKLKGTKLLGHEAKKQHKTK